MSANVPWQVVLLVATEYHTLVDAVTEDDARREAFKNALEAGQQVVGVKSMRQS